MQFIPMGCLNRVPFKFMLKTSNPYQDSVHTIFMLLLNSKCSYQIRINMKEIKGILVIVLC